MATVTPNFNWPVPTSTDLVKDGATAIEALGDSIDASLVDLKGGTTGQVLAKASGTDMDFSWVAQDDSNAIQNTIVDAKGDLIAASAADTPARLAVGNNGETLVADSSTSTGLRYQGSQPAGKNVIYNASLDVWQRGTSFNSTGNDYTADRWYSYRGGIATTVSRQTASLANFTYSIKTQRNSGNTFTTSIYLGQPLEIVDCMQFQGKTVTLSFWAKAGANYSAASSGLGVVLLQGTGSTDTNPFNVGYTGQSAAINTTATLTTSWQRFSYTVTLGSTITQLCPYLDFKPVGTAGADDSFQIVGMQLEASNVATTYARQNGTIQGELAACQRYFEMVNGAGLWGVAINATTILINASYKVQKRVEPTLTGLESALDVLNAGGAGYKTSSGSTYQFSSNTAQGVYGLSAQIDGFTLLVASFPVTVNETNNVISSSAEL
jgi:hypothetical protein